MLSLVGKMAGAEVETNVMVGDRVTASLLHHLLGLGLGLGGVQARLSAP